MGFRSQGCWQPFRISFRLGELSRLAGEVEGRECGWWLAALKS